MTNWGISLGTVIVLEKNVCTYVCVCVLCVQGRRQGGFGRTPLSEADFFLN